MDFKDGFNGTNVFIVISECDAFKTLVRRLQAQRHRPQILFMDIFICEPADVQADGVFHLETFRFHVHNSLFFPLFHFDFFKLNTRAIKYMFQNAVLAASIQYSVQRWIDIIICSAGLDDVTREILKFTLQ